MLMNVVVAMDVATSGAPREAWITRLLEGSKDHDPA